MDVSCPAAGSDPDLFLQCSAIYGHGLAQALDLLPDEAQRAPGFAPVIIARGSPIVKPRTDVQADRRQTPGIRHQATDPLAGPAVCRPPSPARGDG